MKLRLLPLLAIGLTLVFAKNLTDEDGVLSRRPVGMEYNELTMTPPRTVGITGSYNF